MPLDLRIVEIVMRPWQHSRSSAGPIWTNDLPVHEFLDSTKASCADRRHRVVLHHTDLGAEIASRAFPGRTDISAIVKRHVCEDFGRESSFDDWVGLIDQDRLPKPIPMRLEQGWDYIARIIGGRLTPADVAPVKSVIEFLRLPEKFSDIAPSAVLAVTMNASALGIVRNVFGPPRQLNGSNEIVDYGFIAEAVIFTTFGRIPDLREVVDAVTREPTVEGLSDDGC